MSKCRLLFNEQPIVINRLGAKVLGLNEAIVIQQIHYWIDINEKAKINFYESKTWTFNTYEKWQKENFDFWSVRTLKRIFDNLIKKGILIKGNFNKMKYDRTMWVTIDYDKLDEILDDYETNLKNIKNEKSLENVEIPTKCQVDIMSNSNKVPSWHYGKCQVDTMESAKLTLPIPEITKEITKEINTTKPEDKLLVVNTNKELIETKTHLILESLNKENKVLKWNTERLAKAIDIFLDKEGQYFSLLEKIYKDDKNFIKKKSNEYSKKSKLDEYNDRCNMTIEVDGKFVNTKELGEDLNRLIEERNPIGNYFEDLIRNCIESEFYYDNLSPITKQYVTKHILENYKEAPKWISSDSKTNV